MNFFKFNWLYFLISASVILAGLFSIFRWGYTYSIDFTGGTNLEYRLEKVPKEQVIRKVIQDLGIDIIELRQETNLVDLRAKVVDPTKEVVLRSALSKATGSKITVLRFDTVGPVIGRETIQKTIIASLIAIVGILLYMSFAFKGWKFAVAAILALIHDFLVVMGTYSLISHFFGAEFDTLFVTAILTNMSFSVHDTIIIFDKIREYVKHGNTSHIEHDANRALAETLSRSINNSATILFMLAALILLGGSTIHYFVIALFVGTLTGSYSSPFVATPLLVWLEKKMRK